MDTFAGQAQPTLPTPAVQVDSTAAMSAHKALEPDAAAANAAELARIVERRRLQALAGRKDGDASGGAVTADHAFSPTDAGVTVASDSAKDPASPPAGSASPCSDAASPHRFLRSTSPHHLSPATSMIFERDVQETAIVPELAPAVPTHIVTENHIPSVLEASSLAITDEKLGPDDVEIVMHSAHQPAGMAAAGWGEAPSVASLSDFAPSRELPPPLDDGSGYGALDTTDPRRLSFISFADVVHAEHAETKDPLNMLGLTSAGVCIAGNRSPSPCSNTRLPASPQPPGRTSPAGGPVGIKPLDMSPVRGLGPIGSISPVSPGGTTHGELTIETMRQTLEKTASNDSALLGSIDGTARRPSRP